MESARPYTIGYPTLDVLGVGGGRGTSHAIVFNSSPNDLIATYNSFGTTTKPYRDCLRAGTCSIAAFDNARGQPFFQLDELCVQWLLSVLSEGGDGARPTLRLVTEFAPGANAGSDVH